MKLKDLIPEFVDSAYDASMKAFKDDFQKFLKGKKLGGMDVVDIKFSQDGIVEFSTKVDELQLDWMVREHSTFQKKIYNISVSSPIKRGTFEKKISGKNATAAGAWKVIEQIYNGKFKR